MMPRRVFRFVTATATPFQHGDLALTDGEAGRDLSCFCVQERVALSVAMANSKRRVELESVEPSSRPFQPLEDMVYLLFA